MLASTKVIIAVAVLVVAGGVYYAVSNRKMEPSAVDGSVAVTTATTTAAPPKLQPTLVIDPLTSGWNNFDNNEVGFSLRFPNNWQAVVAEDKTVEFRESGKTYSVSGKDVAAIALRIENNPSAKSAQAIATEKLPKATKSEVDVSGYKAVRMESDSEVSTFFATSSRIITITTPKKISDASVAAIYDKIVKTLIFSPEANG